MADSTPQQAPEQQHPGDESTVQDVPMQNAQSLDGTVDQIDSTVNHSQPLDESTIMSTIPNGIPAQNSMSEPSNTAPVGNSIPPTNGTMSYPAQASPNASTASTFPQQSPYTPTAGYTQSSQIPLSAQQSLPPSLAPRPSVSTLPPSTAAPLPSSATAPTATRGATPTAGASIASVAQGGGIIPPPSGSYGSPTRTYINQKVTPTLLEGMKHIASKEPEKPLKWLGDYLLKRSEELEEWSEPDG